MPHEPSSSPLGLLNTSTQRTLTTSSLTPSTTANSAMLKPSTCRKMSSSRSNRPSRARTAAQRRCASFLSSQPAVLRQHSPLSNWRDSPASYRRAKRHVLQNPLYKVISRQCDRPTGPHPPGRKPNQFCNSRRPGYWVNLPDRPMRPFLAGKILLPGYCRPMLSEVVSSPSKPPKAGQARNPTITNMGAPCAEVSNKDSNAPCRIDHLPYFSPVAPRYWQNRSLVDQLSRANEGTVAIDRRLPN